MFFHSKNLIAFFAVSAIAAGSAHATNKQSLDCSDPKLCSAKADLVLSGVVPTLCSISVKAADSAKKLNIQNGEASTLVASVTEATNNPGGYQVTLKSSNAGSLVHNSLPSAKVPYKLSYDGGAPISPTASPQQVKKTMGPLSSPVTDVSDVKITIAAMGSVVAGTYSDTVTFEISAL